MAGTTIKEYARTRGITHEAVRRQIKRYAEELDGHITIQGRTKYLDLAAVEFLDQHRLQKTVVVEPTEQEIDRYRDEVERLNRILEEKNEKIISIMSEVQDLIGYKAQNQLLLEQKDKDQEQLQEVRQELQEVQNKLQETEQEVNSYVRSWFGFYRKK